MERRSFSQAVHSIDLTGLPNSAIAYNPFQLPVSLNWTHGYWPQTDQGEIAKSIAALNIYKEDIDDIYGFGEYMTDGNCGDVTVW